MSNSDQDAAQKQWEARNSDRRDTFEAIKGRGPRTGEVRTIEHQEHTLRTPWAVLAQTGSDGVVSDDPVAVRQVHVWPSDVSPPAEGALVFAEVQSSNVTVARNGNGRTEPESLESWVEVWNLAADGD